MDGTEPFRTCSRGHTYSRDENYQARRGRCPVCHRGALLRYARSEKGQAARRRAYLAYRDTEAKRAANARTNPQRIRVAGMYLGSLGFSANDMEAMLNGSSD